MKIIFTLLLSFLMLSVSAQDDKTVTLTVTGQGKTIDEAKTNALRSAIEQAFGAFISSNTTILDDKLVKDEIVSVANGNIQKFDVLNEISMPDGSYAITLKALVSVSKLTSFCKSKGVKVEFKGELFAQNIAIQELNEKNEILAWNNTKNLINNIMKEAFDYKINVSKPFLLQESKYKINVYVDVEMNENYYKAIGILVEFCKKISLNEDDRKERSSVGKDFFSIIFLAENSEKRNAAKIITLKEMSKGDIEGNEEQLKIESNEYIVLNNKKIKMIKTSFRNKIVANEILLLPWKIANQAIFNFKIENGIDSIKVGDYILQNEIRINSDFTFIIDGSVSWCLFGQNTRNGFLRNSSRENILIRDFYVDNSSKSEPIFNFVGLKSFLNIQLQEIRDLEYIKKISEYKIAKVVN